MHWVLSFSLSASPTNHIPLGPPNCRTSPGPLVGQMLAQCLEKENESFGQRGDYISLKSNTLLIYVGSVSVRKLIRHHERRLIIYKHRQSKVWNL